MKDRQESLNGIIFKPFLLKAIIRKEKTVTRRLIKPNQFLTGPIVQTGYPIYDPGVYETVRNPDGSEAFKPKWLIRTVHPITSSRDKPATASILIREIHVDGDVRRISPDEAKLEGFETPSLFLSVWTSIYDAAATPGNLASRPAELYRAWRIEFELFSVW